MKIKLTSLLFFFLTFFSVFFFFPQSVKADSCPTPFTGYTIPTTNSNPLQMTVGGDGAMWFQEQTGGNPPKLGRITTNGDITEYTPPFEVHFLTAGPDGATWFTGQSGSNGFLGRVTSDGTISQFSLGAGNPGAIALGSDGAFWIGGLTPVGSNPFYPTIIRVTTTGAVTTYPITTTPESPNGVIESLTNGPDGAVWFLYKGNGDGTVNRIGRMDVSDGSITWFPLSGNYNNGSLVSITTGPDGALWFTGYLDSGFIGRLTTTGDLTQYTDPKIGLGLPYGIVAGADGNLWFTLDSDGVGRITLNPFHIDLYHTQTTLQAATPRAIVAGPDNALWFTEQSANKIGKLPLALVPLVDAPEGFSVPNPSTTAPALSWQSVSVAASYGVCRDGNVIDSTNLTNYTDTSSADGTHFYTVFATDAQGNNSSTALGVEVLLDQTPPTLSTPTLTVNPLLSGQTSTLSVTATDATSGIQEVVYTLNGGPQKLMTRSVSNSWRATFTSQRNLSTDLPDGIYTIVVTAIDGVGNQTVSDPIQLTVGNISPTPTPTNTPTPTPVPNVAPVVGSITASANPIQVNTSTTATANFTDGNPGDTHTAVWDWGDGMTSTGSVTENNGSGSVSDSHVYLAAGVYTITLTVTDNQNASGTSVFKYLSVYNPTPQGLFSGARIFTSPAGAYAANPNVSGQVQFGVTSKYQNNLPTGNVSMKFNAANFEFDSMAITVLVTASGKATLRGTGTVNGAGNYNFLVTGIDGANDAIRFQITDSSNNVVYDSQPGAVDTDDPIAAVTGQVIVH